MNKNLFEYIASARAKNLSDEQIKNQLIESGWPKNKVNSAFSVQNLVQVIPDPPEVPYYGMWIGFVYILFFISLYVLIWALSGVFHSWINIKFPDVTAIDNEYLALIQPDSGTVMRSYLSSILITYPICVFLGIFIKMYLLKNRLMVNSRSRRILIYITLIGTYLILVCNIIAAFFELLSGAIIFNIFGNLFVTVLISGSMFCYFISEVKNDRKIY